MKKILFSILCASLITACTSGKEELLKSLDQVQGNNMSVIRSYPTGYSKAINGNKVYVYSKMNKGTVCDIFFEVDERDNILKASYKGEACNSFYNEVLKPK